MRAREFANGNWLRDGRKKYLLRARVVHARARARVQVVVTYATELEET